MATAQGPALPAGGAPAPERRVVTLTGPPGTGGAYLKAACDAWPRPGRRDPGPLPAVEYRVLQQRASLPRLDAYRAMVGEPDDGQLPPGFIHIMAFPLSLALMTRDQFPLPLAGMVHVSNDITVSRSVGVDVPLDLAVWAEGLRPHRRGAQVDIVATASARTGDDHDVRVVWQGRSTYLAKGVRLPNETAPAPLAPQQAATPAPPDPAEAADPTEAQAQAPRSGGSFIPALPTARWQLRGDTGRRYAAISGDRNPIHLSALTAKAFGFPRTVAHGMLTASMLLAAMRHARATAPGALLASRRVSADPDGPGMAGDAYRWQVAFRSAVLIPGSVMVAITPGEPWHVTGQAWEPRSGTLHLESSIEPAR